MYIYYLLYKLNNNNTYWIVKTHTNIDMLEDDRDDLDDYISNDDKYLIVERNIKNKDKDKALVDLDRKQFKIFLFRKSDLIIKTSRSNKINKINKSNKKNKSNKLNKLNKLIKLFCR